jgi:hypothetical protein
MARLDGYPNNTTSAGLDGFPSDDLISGPIGAFDEDIGMTRLDYRLGCVFAEDHDHIHARERRQDLGSFRLRGDRPLRTLVSPDRLV